jgi:hypothetical protein
MRVSTLVALTALRYTGEDRRWLEFVERLTPIRSVRRSGAATKELRLRCGAI